jgi:hypothetical protein
MFEHHLRWKVFHLHIAIEKALNMKISDQFWRKLTIESSRNYNSSCCCFKTTTDVVLCIHKSNA